MIFKCQINLDGKLYMPGEDVPCDEHMRPLNSVNVESKVIEPIKVETPVVEPQNEPQAEKTYTRTEINRLSTEALKKLAKSEGIKDANEKSGNQLKKMLIEHFNI